MIISGIIMFVAALFIVVALTPVFQKIAMKKKIFDIPGPIKSHKKPVSYLGGLAIYGAFCIPILAYGIIKQYFKPELIGILAGGSIVCGLGLIDDIKKLGVGTKFFGQLVATIIAVTYGVRLQIMFLPPALNLILTILWIVGITNALNIIDVMDGQSAGVAFIAAGTFFFIAVPSQNTIVALTAAALGGAALGFLKFNFPPASIFMGDAGSLFLGFLLASMSIMESYTAVNKIALLSPILILAVPIYDTFYVSLLRMFRKKSPFKGSKDHFALRLKALQIKDRNVILIVYLISIALCQASYIATTVSREGAIFIYGAILIACIVIGRNLSKIRVKD